MAEIVQSGSNKKKLIIIIIIIAAVVLALVGTALVLQFTIGEKMHWAYVRYTEAEDGGYAAIITINVKKATIPEKYKGKSITTIESANRASNLIELSFGANVKTVKADAFKNCSAIEKVNYKGSVADWCEITFENENSNPFSQNQAAFYINGKSVSSVEIPADVTELNAYAFYNMSSLTSVSFGVNVTQIGVDAFSGSSINVVNYDGDIKDWCDIEFENEGSNPRCNDETNNFTFKYGEGIYLNSQNALILPARVQNIGQYAFYNFKFSSIQVPVSVKTIGASAFEKANPQKVDYKGSLSDWMSIKFENGYSNPLCAGAELLVNDNKITVLDMTSDELKNKTSIAPVSFYKYAYLEKVKLSDNVLTIGNDAFNGCINLTEIDFAASLKVIEASAFRYCKELQSVTFPDSLKTLGEGAFAECVHLEAFIVPQSVTAIGSGVLDRCVALTYLEIPFCGLSDQDSEPHVGQIFGVTPQAGLVGAQRGEFDETYYIPEGLVEIKLNNCKVKSYMFRDCANVKKITVDDSSSQKAFAAVIEKYAFAGCTSLETLTLQLKTRLETLGTYAFKDCVSLESIVLPDTANLSVRAEELDLYGIFSGCIKLTDITFDCAVYDKFGYLFGCDLYEGSYSVIQDGECYYLPESLTNVHIHAASELNSSIPAGFFGNCYALKNVYISIADEATGITEVGADAFENCTSLESVFIDGGMANWCDMKFDTAFSNPLFYAENLYNGETLINGGDLTIDSSIAQINDYCFYNCKQIESLTVSSETIGNSAFAGCTGLTSIDIDSCDILNDAFAYCSALTSVSLSGNLSLLGNGAFYGCENLETILIPSSVRRIGENALGACWSLKSISTPFALNDGESAAKYPFGYLFGGDDQEKSIKITQEYLQDEDQTIPATYYMPASLTDVNVVSGDIPMGAFEDCRNIVNVVLDDSVKYIDKSAFENCTSLRKVNIGNGVRIIAADAFKGCENLVTITLGVSLSAIDTDAFDNCYSLYEIYNLSALSLTIGEEKEFGKIAKFSKAIYTDLRSPSHLSEIDGFLCFIDSDIGEYSLLNYYGDSESINLPSEIKVIASYAFRNNNTVVEISSFPDSQLTMIGEGAFKGLQTLKNVGFGMNLKEIKISAFEDCVNLERVAKEAGNIQIIGENAFKNCTALTRVSIGNNLISLGVSAFENCESLSEIDLSSPAFTKIEDSTFKGCRSLLSLEVSESIKTIGDSAFEDCSSLEKADLGQVKNLGDYAFKGCVAITDLTLPQDVLTDLPTGAFYGCESLRYVQLPRKLTTIGEQAFYGATALESIKFGEELKIVKQSAFENCSNLGVVIMGKTTSSIKERAFANCISLYNIMINNELAEIENDAFKGCDSLKEVYYDGSVDTWCGIQFGNEYANPLINAERVSSPYGRFAQGKVTIGNTTKLINNYAFYGFVNITDLVIESDSVEIGIYAFAHCPNLKSVTLNTSGDTIIIDRAFEGSSNLEDVRFEGQNYKLHTEIFKGCKLNHIKFGGLYEDWADISANFDSNWRSDSGIQFVECQDLRKFSYSN